MKTKQYFYGLVLGILLIGGCKKLPDYALEPEISIQEIEIIRDYVNPTTFEVLDSVIVKLYYQDGDGDLGISNNDLPISNFNYFLDLEIKENGEFVPYIFPDSNFNFYGKFPQLAPSNVKSPIDGILNYSLSFRQSEFQVNDTVRFVIYIVDRAGNKSNTVTTESIVLKKQ